MATNFYFQNDSHWGEQNLIEELCIEAISIYGIDMFYLKREYGDKDPIYHEDPVSKYTSAIMVDMYIKDSEKGFGGLGDILGNAGLEILDTITFVIARRTFINEVGDYNEEVRPLEGDLIYFPLTRKLYKIQFVEKESIFYQMGSLQVWELRCELFSYSGEIIDTGVPNIDDIFIDYQLDDHFGLGLEGDKEIVLAIEQTGLPLILEDTVIDYIGDNDILDNAGKEIIDFSCMDPFTNGDDF